MHRRSALKMTAALAAAPMVPRFAHASADTEITLAAAPAEAQIAPESYPKTGIWAYGGTLPGPEIRAPQGSRLRRRLVNNLPDPTSIHWHGIRIDNAMDGVPGLTQDPVPPGGDFLYDFLLPDAGTYWYHSHNQSYAQVARGLLGPLIIEEPTPPDVDRDEVLLLDDFRLDPETAQITPFENMHDFSHAGRIGNISTTNGTFNATLPAKRGERLRLRLINGANARIFTLSLDGLEGWVMALDGMPLAEPTPVDGTFHLSPAQRVDLIVDVTAPQGEDANLVRHDRDETYSQVLFPLSGSGSASERGAPAPLPPNPGMDVPGLAGAVTTSLRMEGGAMRGFTSAEYQGRQVGFREAAGERKFWALNGVIDMPKDPLLTLDRGQTVRVQLANDTAFPHSMHLHGHHFREVLAGGGLGPMRDTLLMFADERREIAFVADNPGEWLFHCHMLTHAAAGMLTRIRVLA